MHKISIPQIQKYFKLLKHADPTDAITVALFSGDTPAPGMGCVHTTVGALPGLVGDNNWQAHVSLNTTNGKGRRTEHMKHARVLCLDIDRVLSQEEITEIAQDSRCHMLVVSSPGKYHLYWKIRDISLEVWKRLQLGLAKHYDGDRGLDKVTSMIRVPGIARLTKSGEPFMPKVVWVDDKAEALDLTGVQLAMPWIATDYETALIERKAEQKELRKKAKKTVKALKDKMNGESMDDTDAAAKLLATEGRNTALYFAVFEVLKLDPDLDMDGLTAHAEKINESFDTPLSAQEVAIVVKKVFRRGEEYQSTVVDRDAEVAECLGVVDDGDHTQNGHVVSQNDTNGEREAGWAGGTASYRPAIVAFAAQIAAIAEVHKAWKAWKRSGGAHALAAVIAGQWSAIGGRSAYTSICYPYVTQWGKTVIKKDYLSAEKLIVVCDRIIYELSLRLVSGEKKPKMPAMAVIRDAARTLANELGLTREQDQPDSIVVFQNGVFNLDTKHFTPDAQAAYKHSNAVWADYSGGLYLGMEKDVIAALREAAPLTAGYMQDWFPGDHATWLSLLRWIGYCLTTDTTCQTAMFFHGVAAGGKGSLSQIIHGLIGDDNWLPLPYEALDGGFELAELHGKLVLCVDELEARKWEHEKRLGKLKQILGGEQLTLHRKFRDPVSRKPVAKILLISNEPISYADKKNSIQRRMVAVEFENSHAGKSGQPSLDVLRHEADALAMLATIAWADCRGKVEPFRVPGSRALDAGRDVTDKLNFPAYVVDNFVEVDTSDTPNGLPARMLVLLTQALAGIDGLPVQRPKQIGTAIAARIKLKFNMTACSLWASGSGAYWGYLKLKIRRKNTLDKYPELLDLPMAEMGVFSELLTFLQIAEKTDNFLV